jgi:hypothetical protein
VQLSDIEGASGSADNPGVTFGPPEGDDVLLYVGISGLDIAITEGNIATYANDLADEVDQVFRQRRDR